MLSMLISIDSILYILFLEKYFFLKFYQYSPYHWTPTNKNKTGAGGHTPPKNQTPDGTLPQAVQQLC